MNRISAWMLPVPGEGRPAVAAGVGVLIAAAVVGCSAAAAWNAPESSALVALTVAVAAFALGCGALAGYAVWLRRTVTARTTALLRRAQAGPAR